MPWALLKSPKLLGGLVVLLALSSVGVHYWLVVNERNNLREERTELRERLADREADITALEVALEDERAAAAIVAGERNEARRALQEFRAGREDDPEAQEWAAQPLPEGELERLCQTLPEMDGCQPAIEP